MKIIFLILIINIINLCHANTDSFKKFLWGASFSAHQTEGGNDYSDWWEWEHISGKISKNDTTAIATDHYNRYKEDFAIAEKLGLNVVRFSISWSRIEKENGLFDETEIDHYIDVLLDLRARGLEPVITLHHFANPIWFQRLGGWSSPDAPKYFERFAKKISKSFFPYVRLWITFNEPIVVLTEGYLKGGYPPGHSDLEETVVVFENLVRAHGLAAKALRKNTTKCRPKQDLAICGVGLALNMHWFEPANTESIEAAKILSHLQQWAFFEATIKGKLQWKIPEIPILKAGRFFSKEIPEAKNSVDWMGINYYSSYKIKRDPFNDLGIEWIDQPPENGLKKNMRPAGLRKLLNEASARLRELGAQKIPLIVSENGLDDASDKMRQKFIASHVEEMKKAIEDGNDVRGYWYWSLTDNFEWLMGFEPRYGLVNINYFNLNREFRPSAFWFRDMIKE